MLFILVFFIYFFSLRFTFLSNVNSIELKKILFFENGFIDNSFLELKKSIITTMNLLNFGREQLENGSLNDMLKQVGIDDVGSFVNQFRSKVNQETASQSQTNTASAQQPDYMAMGSSLLNQVSFRGKFFFLDYSFDPFP